MGAHFEKPFGQFLINGSKEITTLLRKEFIERNHLDYYSFLDDFLSDFGVTFNMQRFALDAEGYLPEVTYSRNNAFGHPPQSIELTLVPISLKAAEETTVNHLINLLNITPPENLYRP